MISSAVNFAAASNVGPSLRVPWPLCPFLELPLGRLEVLNGTLILHSRWVVAIALSPKHLIVTSRAPARENCVLLVEQAVGFWHGRDAEIVRLPIRCEREWFRTMPTGDMDIRRCVSFWARNYFSTNPCTSTNLPANIWPIISLANILDAGHRFWTDAGHVLAGLEAYDSGLIYDVSPLVAAQARNWEYHVARWILRISQCGDISPLDQGVIAQVDRCFLSVVSRFLPNHEVLPSTLARLL